MSFKKNLIIYALLVIMLVFCVSAVSASDEIFNMTLGVETGDDFVASEDVSDVALESDVDGDFVASEDVSDVALESDVDGDFVASDSNNDKLGDEDIIYVDASNSQENPDGSLNNPFNSLVTALSAVSDGGTVFVKNGNYIMSNTVRVGFTLIGESRDGVILTPSSRFANGLTVNTGQGVSSATVFLSNITFLANPSYTNYGLYINAADLVMYNCSFYNFSRDHIYINKANKTEIYDCYSNGKIAYCQGGQHSLNNVSFGYLSVGSNTAVKYDTILNVDNCTIGNSKASTLFTVEYGGVLNINNSTIENVKSDNFLYSSRGETLIESCLIENSEFKKLIEEYKQWDNSDDSIVNFKYNAFVNVAVTEDFIKLSGRNPILNYTTLDYNWWGTNKKLSDIINYRVYLNASTKNDGDNVVISGDLRFTDGENFTKLNNPIFNKIKISVVSSNNNLNSIVTPKNNHFDVSFVPNGDFYITVNEELVFATSIIYVDSSFEGEGLGTIDNPYKNITYAITKATGDGTTIFVKNGRYSEELSTIIKSLNIIGESKDGVIITGGNKGIFNSPSILSNNVYFSLTNLTFKDTACDGLNAVLSISPAVKELNINNCSFNNCTGSLGAISVSSPNLIIDGCEIVNFISTAEGVGSAAIYINNEGTSEIKNTIIDNSQCIGNHINGIIVVENDVAALTLENVQIVNNRISALSVISAGKLNIKNSKFQNNTLNFEESSLISILSNTTIQNTVFSDNVMDNLILADGVTVDIEGSNIEGNTVKNIISIYNNADAKISNVEFLDNVVNNVIYLNDSIATINTLTISNSGASVIFNVDENSQLKVIGGLISENDVKTIFKVGNYSSLVVDGIKIYDNNVTNIFVNCNSKIDVENSLILNNNCTGELIYNLEENSNITLNYNIIINNNEKSITNKFDSYNLNYNWWGTNDKPNEYVDNWAIMEIEVTKIAGDVDVTVYINEYYDGKDISPLSRNLPDGILVNVESSSKEYSELLTVYYGSTGTTFPISDNDEYVTITSNDVNITVSISSKTIYVDVNFEGNGNGSVDAPYTTIQEAIDHAQDQDTIIVKEGVYSEKITWIGGTGLNICGENENVVLNLTSGSLISPRTKKISLINLKFLGNKNNMNFAVYNYGSLDLINCTFDDFILSRELISSEFSNSNILNTNFLNIELSQYSSTLISKFNAGDHMIKNVIMSNLKYVASRPNYISDAVLYVGGQSNVKIDNLTMNNVDSYSNGLIRTNSILNITNSKFIDNTLHKLTSGWREYGGQSLFFNSNGELTIETSIIKDNFGSNYLIYNEGLWTASNMNYNVITDNTLNNGIATTTGVNNLDYNWWGSNTPNYSDANTWVIIDASYSPESVVLGDNVTVTAIFNHYTTKDGEIGELTKSVLGDDEVTFIYVDGTVINKTTKNGVVNITYTINQSENVTIKAYGEEITVPITLKTLRINIDEVNIDGNTNITVLAPGVNANMTLIIDGVSKTVEVKDSYTETLENLKAGVHSVVVIYNDGANFEFDSKSFTVEKLPTQINMDNITVDAGVNVPLEFTIAEDATGSVFVEINGVKSFNKLVDGTFHMDLENLAIGNNTISVSYEGDAKYLGTTKTIQITVNGLDSGLKANTSDIKVGEDAVIDIEINKEVSGDVRVLIGNEVIPVTLIDGKATVKIPNLPADAYTATVQFVGDNKYLACEFEVTFKVDKVDLPEEINITTDIPEGTTAPEFSINLPEDATGNFTVYVDGIPYVQELVNGSATVKVPEQTPGNHTISTEYSGDAKYPGFKSDNSTMNVPKANVPGGENALNMTTPSNSATPTYTINLPKDAKGNLTVTVDGKDTYTKALENGSATVTVPELASGKHDITVTYTGDDKYASISKTTSVNVPAKSTPKKPVVKKQATKITAKKKTFKASKKVKKYTITLKAGKKPVKKVTVTIKVGKKTYKAKTNAKGKATFKLKKLTKKGKYKAVIKFKGYKNYKASSKKVRITVKK